MEVKLTPREEAVAALIAEGWQHKRIAKHLQITRVTVSVLAARVSAKIGCPDDALTSVCIARWWGRNRDAA